VNVLCGGSTSLPRDVVIPNELTASSKASLKREVASKLKHLSYVDSSEDTFTTTDEDAITTSTTTRVTDELVPTVQSEVATILSATKSPVLHRTTRSTKGNSNSIANAKANANSNTSIGRKAYTLPLSKTDKDQINAGAPLPVNEDNTEFDHKNKNINGLCGNPACKSVVEKWWSGLASSQLVTVHDFKKLVPQIANCSKCSNVQNLGPKILQSMSFFKPLEVKESNSKKVKLYEISNKRCTQ